MTTSKPPLASVIHIKDARHRASREETPWGSLTWMVSGSIGNSAEMTLGRVCIKAGESNPRHCHPDCEETLYLLRGRLLHSYGDQQVEMGPGDTLSIPAGVHHNGKCIGVEDADMIVIYGSPQRGFVKEMQREVAQ